MLIDSEAALQANLRGLLALDPVMADMHAAGVIPPLRKRDGGFGGLIAIIMAQQLSVASAAAITARLRAAVAPFSPENLLATPVETLIAAGLSQPKIRATISVAEAAVSGRLDFEALAGMSGEAAHAALVDVKGIGPWTADIYLLFCLGHPDVFPAGDLALQEAARLALHLETRPDETLMATLARRWSPYRGVAALMLWAFYAVTRGREGVISAPAELADTGRPSPGRAWRPGRRAALAALLQPDDGASPPDMPGWADILEALHASDMDMRRAAAATLGGQITGAFDSRHAGALAGRIAAEPEPALRRALMPAAARLASDAASASRLFAALSRVAGGQDGGRPADRLAALGALEILARRHPELTARWRRLLAGLDAGGSRRLQQFLAKRL